MYVQLVGRVQLCECGVVIDQDKWCGLVLHGLAYWCCLAPPFSLDFFFLLLLRVVHCFYYDFFIIITTRFSYHHYCQPSYGVETPSTFAKLDTIQNTAPRLAVGAMRSQLFPSMLRVSFPFYPIQVRCPVPPISPLCNSSRMDQHSPVWLQQTANPWWWEH